MMRLDPEQLRQHLQRGLKSLYTVYGDEPLLALEAADSIRAAARTAGFAEREIFTVDAGFDWQRLAISSRSPSLFAVKKLIDLRIPSGKPGSEGAQAIADFCAAVGPELMGLVQLPKLDRQSQSSKWFGALADHGPVVSVKVVERTQLPQWINARLAAQNQNADAETLQFISDRVEGNLLAAYQEVQKLALLFPEGNLSFEQVRESVLEVARYDIFKLSEAMLMGDAVRIARILDGLRGEGTPLPLILWAVSEDIRTLLKIVSGSEQGKAMQQLLHEAHLWGARQGLMQRAAERCSRSMLEDAVLQCAQLDRMIKGLASGNIWDEFLKLGMRFCFAPVGVKIH
ncbi:MAG TPA: DNA polymerase III subunit delta [Burkholderiales bacterium]|nr:DNA polymerase III subunit delta [Burkholderiales bacterium]